MNPGPWPPSATPVFLLYSEQCTPIGPHNIVWLTCDRGVFRLALPYTLHANTHPTRATWPE